MEMKHALWPAIIVGACIMSARAADVPAQSPEDKAKQLAAWRQEAKDVGAAYQGESVVLRNSLQTNNLAGANAAAAKMVELAAWKPPDPSVPASLKTTVHATSLTIARQFAEKQLYGARHARKYYDKAVSSAGSPAEAASVALEHAGFLYDNAQVPEAEARQMMAKALAQGGLEVGDRVRLLLTRARMCDGVDFEDYIGRAFDAAGGDGALLLQVYQAQFPRNRDPVVIVKSREMLSAIAQKALSDKRLDKFRFEDVSSDVPSLVAFLVARYNSDPFFRFGESLQLLDEALKAAPDAAARNKWRTLQIQTHQRAGARYYAAPDPKSLAAIRDVLLAMIPDQAADVETARLKIGLMDVCHKLGDTAGVQKYASELLRDYSGQEKSLPRAALAASIYLGLLAYAEEEYPKALGHLAPLVEDGAVLKSDHAIEVPLTSDRRTFIASAMETAIRSYCAVGDYKKAYALKDALLARIGRDESPMYKTWFEGLSQRAARRQSGD